MTDGAPESAHQPVQRLYVSYYAPVPYSLLIVFYSLRRGRRADEGACHSVNGYENGIS